MLATILKFAGSLVSKEFLISVFKEVFLEFAVELLEDFAKSTKNTYDDKLVEKFKEFLEDEA